MQNTDTRMVLDGLEKLAFGKVNDAVVLAFAEELPSPTALRRMNLFNVSSIKRVKGGGVEVQFFDRQRALERLYEFAREGAESDTAASLFAALAGEGDDAV